MKYKFSNTEVSCTSEDGKRQVYKVCDLCGTKQKSNYGYEVQYAKRGSWAAYRRGLCSKCAAKLIPIMEEAMQRIREEEQAAMFLEGEEH